MTDPLQTIVAGSSFGGLATATPRRMSTPAQRGIDAGGLVIPKRR
jgi:hypothetical protein